nr:MAG TPA: major tail protein [Caudoviricetes sp.]
MTTGLRASTFENLQLNAGMFLANFDYFTATDAATLGALLKTEREKTSGSALIGATRGGGTFVCTPNTRSIEADGKREEWKGSSVNDGWTIKLTTTLLEINASNLKRSFGTADVTDTEKKHTIKIRTDIKDADYIDSLVWVGDTSKGYVLIAIKNALNTAGATLTWTDKGEGTIPVEFTAHQDGLETDGYAPCEVIFFDPAA